MTEANLNKHFVFYLDSFGNILGAKLESPSIEVSMTLSQMIGYHFILDLDEAYASATMVFEKNGVTSGPVSGERLADGKYQFTYTMTAKEADDAITATLYYGGDVLTSAQTSGSAYLTAVEATYGADSTYGRIAAAALNYSKAAQIYFQYGSYESVSLDLSGVSVADQDTYFRFVDSSDPNVTYYGKSFLAKDVTILRIWLRTAAAPEVTVTLDGQPVNGVKVAANALNAGYYCIDIPVAPGNLSKFFHIAVAGAMEFDMGVYDYVKQALSEQSEKTALVDLCKALYAYGEAAK